MLSFPNESPSLPPPSPSNSEGLTRVTNPQKLVKPIFLYQNSYYSILLAKGTCVYLWCPLAWQSKWQPSGPLRITSSYIYISLYILSDLKCLSAQGLSSSHLPPFHYNTKILLWMVLPSSLGLLLVFIFCSRNFLSFPDQAHLAVQVGLIFFLSICSRLFQMTLVFLFVHTKQKEKTQNGLNRLKSQCPHAVKKHAS